MRRLSVVAEVDTPGGIVETESRIASQKIHIGLPQTANGSHVLPIAIKGIGKHTASVVQHSGNHVLTEVLGGVRVRLVPDQVLGQKLSVKDIDTHGRLGALGMRGFLLEFQDAVVLIGIHNAEAAGLIQRHVQNGNGTVRTRFLMLLQHLAVVHFIDMVTGQNQHVVRIITVDEIQILIDRIGGTLIPVCAVASLIRRQNAYTAGHAVQIPGLTVADILIQNKRLILGQNTHGINTGIHAVGHRKIDDTVFAAKLDCRLCRFLRQRVQTGSLAAGQEHSHALFLLVHFRHLVSFIY